MRARVAIAWAVLRLLAKAVSSARSVSLKTTAGAARRPAIAKLPCPSGSKFGITTRIYDGANFRFGTLVGCGIKAKLERLAATPQLAGRVLFTGFLSHAETRAVLATHNIFLCPSKHALNSDAEGGFPVALAEAMVMGLVCIGSRHCDIPEVIRDHKTGFQFDEGDAKRLTDILCTIAAQPEAMPALADAGGRHIEEQFNLLTQLASLAGIYRDCIGCRVED